MNYFFSMLKRIAKFCCTPVGVLYCLLIVGAISLTCTGPILLKKSVQKVLAENPSILIKLIKENPLLFMESIREASKLAQQKEGLERKKKEEKEFEAKFDDPLEPKIRRDENIRGNPDAPITLVEYSDFECPFCGRALAIVEELRKQYGSNLRFIYKHLPLSFHPQAMLAAKYYEAIRVQSSKKAWKFHDELLQNVSKVRKGENYFKSVAKKLQVNIKKLTGDINSEKVKTRIEQDVMEAKNFGIQGTPGFLINGIPVKGAYPASHFNQIIDKLRDQGKLSL